MRNDEVERFVAGVTGGDRAVLGQAITLVESSKPQHQELAQELLVALYPHAGNAHRVGITGVPGVGKSTFIETLGTNLTTAGHRVAVLAVDPTSSRTGGSIMGDKTRMPHLSINDNAFIRSSPTSGTLGGVHRSTRETMTVVEAAGYDVVLVETVGVGQSETVVSDMVDFFLVLMLSGAGDELQGIKKGVLELADMVAVNKADGDNEIPAKAAARNYQAALRLMMPASPNWNPPVVTCSGLTNLGIEEVWEQIELHRTKLTASGEFDERRQKQLLRWLWATVDERVLDAVHHNPTVASIRADLEARVLAGQVTPSAAANEVLRLLG